MTFLPTDAALVASLTRALGFANRVLVEDETLASANLTVYYGARQNWMTVPPPQVYLNGVQNTSATVSHVSGSVTFSNAQSATSVISASYWYTPLTTTDLSDMLTDAAYFVTGQLGSGFDGTSALNDHLREPCVTAAQVMAMRFLQAETAEYYRWSIDGRMVDRGGVTRHFDVIIHKQNQRLQESLSWLRPQYLAEGIAVTLNIDRGLPPSRFSRYRASLLLNG